MNSLCSQNGFAKTGEYIVLTNLIMLGVVLVGSTILTGWTRRYAVRTRLFDRPNERSSHSRPIPRGGGLAIVVAFLLAISYLTLSGELETSVFVALSGGALVAAIGYWDDRRDPSARTRIVGHFLAASWATLWIGGIPHLDLYFTTWEWGGVGYIVSIVGIVWLLNLYNFMDGIDGIAASEAIFVASVGGALLLSAGATGLALAALTLAATSAGFLVWNWPPAKIFMGDVGSGFLGYTLAVLAIASDQESDVSLWVWLLLLGVFVVDATLTLLRRLLRGEKISQAHRDHAYQHAAIQFNSHLKVTLGIAGINIGILLPIALVTWKWPNLAVITVVVSLILLAVLALCLGAGSKTQQRDDKLGPTGKTPTEVHTIPFRR